MKNNTNNKAVFCFNKHSNEYVEFEYIDAEDNHDGIYYRDGFGFKPFYSKDGEEIGMTLVSVPEPDSCLTTLILPEWCKRIDNDCFSKRQKETLNIVIANGVKQIGNGVFEGCKKLERCVFDSLDVIGDRAFGGCSKMKYGPDLSDAFYIGEKAFAYCKNLNGYIDKNHNIIDGNIVLSGKLISLNKVFSSCENLTQVTFKKPEDYNKPRTITLELTFDNCINLKTINGLFDNEDISVIMKDGVFHNCGLESVVIGPNVTLGNNSFSECHNLKTAIVNTNVIPGCCFNSCSNLESLTLLNNVKKIGVNAFTKTSKLEFVDFNKVETVDQCAFYYGGIKRYKGTPEFGPSCFERSQIEDIVIGNKIEEDCYKFCENAKRVILTDGFSIDKVGHKSIPLHALSKEQVEIFDIDKLTFTFDCFRAQEFDKNALNKLKSILPEYNNCLYYPKGDNKYECLIACLSLDGDREKSIPMHPKCVSIVNNLLDYQNVHDMETLVWDSDKEIIYDDVINHLHDIHTKTLKIKANSGVFDAPTHYSFPKWEKIVFDNNIRNIDMHLGCNEEQTVVFPRVVNNIRCRGLITEGTYVLPEKCNKIFLDEDVDLDEDVETLSDETVKLILRSNSHSSLKVKEMFEKVISKNTSVKVQITENDISR